MYFTENNIDEQIYNKLRDKFIIDKDKLIEYIKPYTKNLEDIDSMTLAKLKNKLVILLNKEQKYWCGYPIKIDNVQLTISKKLNGEFSYYINGYNFEIHNDKKSVSNIFSDFYILSDNNLIYLFQQANWIIDFMQIPFQQFELLLNKKLLDGDLLTDMLLDYFNDNQVQENWLDQNFDKIQNSIYKLKINNKLIDNHISEMDSYTINMICIYQNLETWFIEKNINLFNEEQIESILNFQNLSTELKNKLEILQKLEK